MEPLLMGLCERKTLSHMGKRERRSISKGDVALHASFYRNVVTDIDVSVDNVELTKHPPLQ